LIIIGVALLVAAFLLSFFFAVVLFLCIAEPSSPSEWDWTQESDAQRNKSSILCLL